MSATIPEFTLENDLWWTTTTLLPSWKGFRSRRGAYGARDSSIPSDGVIRIVFAPEGRGTEPLTNSEISAIQWVIEHEALMSSALTNPLLKKYPSLQKQYGYSTKKKSELMPDVKSEEDLHRLIGLSSVNVHQVQKDGIPYVSFEFG